MPGAEHKKELTGGSNPSSSFPILKPTLGMSRMALLRSSLSSASASSSSTHCPFGLAALVAMRASSLFLATPIDACGEWTASVVWRHQWCSAISGVVPSVVWCHQWCGQHDRLRNLRGQPREVCGCVRPDRTDPAAAFKEVRRRVVQSSLRRANPDGNKANHDVNKRN